MHILLKILRKIGQFLVSWMLWIVLGSGLTFLATSTHLTNRETVKQWPVEAQVYENLIDIVPSIIAEEGGTDDGKTLTELSEESGLDIDRLIAALEKVVTPEYIESQANVAIDALYDALDGSKDVFSFRLELSDKSEEIEAALVEELTAQIREYPACTPLELTELASGEFEPFKAKCIPPGVDIDKEIGFTSADLSGGEDSVVQDVRVSAGDVPFINRNISSLQDSYAVAVDFSQILVGSTLLLGVLMIILAPSVLRGIRKFGVILFIQGVSTALLYFFMPRLSGVAIDNISADGGEGDPAQDAIIEKIVEPLFTTVLEDIARTGFHLGIFVTIAGAALWLGVYTWHKVHHHPQDAHAPKKAVTKKTSDDQRKSKHSLEEF